MMNYFAKLTVFTAFGLLIAACGGGGSLIETPAPSPTPAASPTPAVSPSPTPSPSPSPDPNAQTISGTLSYDFVPHLNSGGLNYEGTASVAIKGVVVQLLDSTDGVESTTISDEQGRYSFVVQPNTAYRIRVMAELDRNQTPTWSVRVTDNTDNNSLYVMDGNLVSSGTSSTVRDLHAASGWDEPNNRYASDEARVAAPFAILDSIYQILDTLESEGFEHNFPATEVRWSVNNTSDISTSNFETGDIGTSFFTTAEGGVMYILGKENVDTDEYDRSIVQHEFGHYLESALSRSDSLGGPHSILDSLDPRIAFGEGFANALTAAVSGSGIYQDSAGIAQAGFQSFGFSLERLFTLRPGWFSEDSTGNIIYDILDNTAEPGDDIDLRLVDVMNVLASDEYKNHPALTTIYLFLDQLKAVTSTEIDASIDNLATEQQIFGAGPYGQGETNDGGISISLPVYHQLGAIGSTIELCSRADDIDFNNYLGVHRLLRFDVSNVGSHDFSITQSSGLTGRDPDANLYRQGVFLSRLNSGVEDSETRSLNLQLGEHILDVFDYKNTQEDEVRGAVCFDVQIREGS